MDSAGDPPLGIGRDRPTKYVFAAVPRVTIPNLVVLRQTVFAGVPALLGWGAVVPYILPS